MGKKPKSFIDRVFKILIILGILWPFFNPIVFGGVKAKTRSQKQPHPNSEYTFSQIGESTEVVQEESYDEAGFIQKALISLNLVQVETHLDLKRPVLGFSIKADKQYDIKKITFIATKKDGTKTPLLLIEEAEAPEGEEIIDSPQKSSLLYTFDQLVTALDFYHPDNLKFEVQEFYDDGTTNAVMPSFGQLLTEPAAGETFFASDAAEKTYIKNLFGNLGVTIKTRDEWGAPTKSLWDPPIIEDINRVIVHHTATSTGGSNPSPIIMAIYNYHVSLGWLDIGYNYVIDVNGNIYEGRGGGNGVKGAHAGSTVEMHGQPAGLNANYGSAGIAILGDYTSQSPSQASIEALAKLIGAISTINNFDPAWHNNSSTYNTAEDPGVYAHRDVLYTACPGNKFYTLLPTISSAAQSYKNGRTDWKSHLDKIQALSESSNYMRDSGKAEIVVQTGSISDLIKEKLLTNSRGVSTVEELSGKILYTAEEDKVLKVVSESILVDENTKAQPNFIYKLESWDNTDPDRSVPSDYNASVHWNYEKINTPEGWKNLGGCDGDSDCLGSSSVTVAVLDTGVAYEDYNYDAGTTFSTEKIGGLYHEVPSNSTPDGQYNEGYDREYTDISSLSHITFVNPYDFAQDFLCDLRSTSPGDECTATENTKKSHANDDHGHGTAVTSIIAAQTGDAAPDRIVGIASNVQIMPVKVFLPNDVSMCQDALGSQDLTCADEDYDYRSVSTSSILADAINYAVDNGADIINLSLSGPAPDYLVQDAVERAYSYGRVVVVAAGNNGSNASNYSPANVESAITVGAVDQNNARSYYSNYGEPIDVVAPVGNSSTYGAPVHTYDCYTDLSCSDETDSNLFKSFSSATTPHKSLGTSFAAPQVVGIVAILKSQNANVKGLEASNVLQQTALELDSADSYYTGYGLVDMEAATNYLSTIAGTNPNDNPSANGDNSSDIIAFDPSTTKVDVTPSTGTNFGGGNRGYEVYNSNTTFSPSSWLLLKPADVSGDGYLDLIAFNKISSAIWVALGGGNEFGRGYKNAQIWNICTGYSTSIYDFLPPADVNGDGKADIIAFNRYNTAISVFLSNGLTFGGGWMGNQTWNHYAAYSPSQWDLLDPIDVTGDGKADIIAFNRYTTQIDVTPSTGTNFGGGNRGYEIWNLQSAYSTANWQILAPADVNGDGKADIIAVNKQTTQVDVTKSTGSNFGGGYRGYEVWNTKSAYSIDQWDLLDPEDVNNDGYADLIAFNRYTTQIDVTPSVAIKFGTGYKSYEVWNSFSAYSNSGWVILNK